jgi:hypothetical protein
MIHHRLPSRVTAASRQPTRFSLTDIWRAPDESHQRPGLSYRVAPADNPDDVTLIPLSAEHALVRSATDTAGWTLVRPGKPTSLRPPNPIGL